jgi:HSP20 family molecular chaperone IbpA
MFKKQCPRCNERVKGNYDYCPSCGYSIKSKKDDKDYGLLGKNDFMPENNQFIDLGNSFIERLLSSAMKELPALMKNFEKQISNQEPSETLSNAKVPTNLNVQFFVNGKRVFPGKKENSFKTTPEIRPENKVFNEKIQNMSKLPRLEPSSKLKRIDNKVIYELEVPGVTNINDVLINKLENSIEIKALAKDNVYLKNLSVNLPLISYKLIGDNLVLELLAK